MTLESLVYEVKVNAGNSMKVLGNLDAKMQSLLSKTQSLNSALLKLASDNSFNKLNESIKTTSDESGRALKNIDALSKATSKIKPMKLPRSGGMPQASEPGSQNNNRPKKEKSSEELFYRDFMEASRFLSGAANTLMGFGKSFDKYIDKGIRGYDEFAGLNAKIATYFGASAEVRNQLVKGGGSLLYGNMNPQDAYNQLLGNISDMGKKGDRFLTENTLQGIVAEVAAIGMDLNLATSQGFMSLVQDLSVARFGATAEITHQQQRSIANLILRGTSGRAGALRNAGIKMSDEEVKFLNTSKNDDARMNKLIEIISRNVKGLASEANKRNPKLAMQAQKAEDNMIRLAVAAKKIQEFQLKLESNVLTPIKLQQLQWASKLADLFGNDGLPDHIVKLMAFGEVAGTATMALGQFSLGVNAMITVFGKITTAGMFMLGKIALLVAAIVALAALINSVVGNREAIAENTYGNENKYGTGGTSRYQEIVEQATGKKMSASDAMEYYKANKKQIDQNIVQNITNNITLPEASTQEQVDLLADAWNKTQRTLVLDNFSLGGQF